MNYAALKRPARTVSGTARKAHRHRAVMAFMKLRRIDTTARRTAALKDE
jgi:hypothetical protein